MYVNKLLLYVGLVTCLSILIILSLSMGAIHIPLNKIFSVLKQPDSSVEQIIIHSIRLPRTLCAVIVGAASALTGVILFYISRNDLACPSLLGINQGVFFGIILSVIFNSGILMHALLITGLITGAFAGLVTFFLAYKLGYSPLKLILIGQTINLFFYALCQFLLILVPEQADLLLINLNGSLANCNWMLLKTFGMILTLSIIVTLIFIKKNYLLSLSIDIAKNIGVNVNAYLFLFFAVLMIMCASSVAMVGPLLFFPLLVVQCSKLFVSSNQPYHFSIISILLGSILLLASDLFIRSQFPYWEAPLNLFIALLGVPLLILRARSTNAF